MRMRVVCGFSPLLAVTTSLAGCRSAPLLQAPEHANASAAATVVPELDAGVPPAAARGGTTVAPYVSKTGCVPRGLDPAPQCDEGKTPVPDDRVTAFSLNGPDTGGDQGHVPPVCFGLLLEIDYASGLHCRQRIGSFDEIGIMGGGPVFVDDEPVCFRLSRGALEVRRKDVTIAKVPRSLGMSTAQPFPEICKEADGRR